MRALAAGRESPVYVQRAPDRRPGLMDLGLARLLEAFASLPRAQVAVLVTIVETYGSAYRKPGAMMLIEESGATHGLLSGGCLETDLAEHARRALEGVGPDCQAVLALLPDQAGVTAADLDTIEAERRLRAEEFQPDPAKRYTRNHKTHDRLVAMRNATHTLVLKVNGRDHCRAVPEAITLLDFLREEIGLTGSKRGCDLGECGCCTVLVDGRPMLSCLLLAAEVADRDITTIEGLADGPNLHPVQQALVEEGAIQCGFCTPSMALNAAALLESNPDPDEVAIKTCVSGTICRCTGYSKIERAVRRAADRIGRSRGE